MKYFLFFCFIFYTASASSQLTIILDKIPSTTPDQASIFIAGNFNQWNPGNVNYKFIENNDGKWQLTFSPPAGKLEFKFTRGSWTTVEGSESGTFIPNRTYQYNGQTTTISLTILGWEGLSLISTATPQVKIMTDSFYIPALNRYRRIWLYLPKDYNTTSKTYSVVYMHDGQNLFNKATSFSGEWKVDETLDSLYEAGYETSIVVGIDNGGGKRLDEYSPWVNAQYGGGEGEKYIDFIVNELKPYIDNHYRSKTDAAHTAIIGSSMGGLISLYAGIKHPDVFGKIGPLSSAFWFSPSSYTFTAEHQYTQSEQKIYMIAGGKEGGDQVGDMYKMRDILLEHEFPTSQLLAIEHADEGHNEAYWAKEFPNVYQWLFAKSSYTKDTNAQKLNCLAKDDSICITGALVNENTIAVYTMNGLKMLEAKISNNQPCIKSNALNTGLYAVTLLNMDNIIYSGTVLVK